MPLFRFLLVFFVFFALRWPVAIAVPTSEKLTFESEADAAMLRVFGGQSKVKNGVLQVEFAAGNGYPQLQMNSPTPLDWVGKSLAMQIKNAGETAVEIGIRVDDAASGDGWNHSWTARATLERGETQNLVFDLGADPMQRGMRGLPPAPGIEGAKMLQGTGAAALDTSHVTSWQLFTHAPPQTIQLEIDNLTLTPSASLNLEAIVDEWGQYSRADWPGKLNAAAQFGARRDEEAALLANPPVKDDLDRFGGWARGPKLDATGFFRTQKVGGKWWLIDPEGHLFFSSGVDVVQHDNPTIIAGRETMFARVPLADEPFGGFRGEAQNVLRGPVKSGLTYDFFRANLQRKYGDDWLAKWRQTTLLRLKNWGFNTLGNWSSAELKVPDIQPRLPYVATSGIYGDHARLSDGEDYWAKMHDPFDPNFAGDAGRALAEVGAKTGDDPFCLGYFVENELSWGSSDSANPKRYFGLVYGALNSPLTQPAKAALVKQLRKKYPGIGLLNRAWDTKFESWAALDAPYEATATPNDAMKADFSAFLSSLSDKYFETVAAELKKVAPHHLYLGPRFSGRPPIEVSRSAAAHCDVVSFNIYAPSLDAEKWAFLNELNKPVMIGEFHIGSTDRGVWMPGLVAAPSQKERAQTFKKYVESVLDNPNFVGCHWFQYIDQPNTGRVLDGENYNIGFVDVTDTPYEDMVKAAKEVHDEIYARRSGQ